MTTAEIKTINLRIANLIAHIEIETNYVACWNMCRDLAQERAKLA